jgi:tRNA threonylcarbamoyladenosine biosynthesis protein TsaE
MTTHPLSAAQTPFDLDFVSHGPEQTIRVGQRLGALLQPGDLVPLYGEFGAGKTHLIKGIVQGLGSDELVTSPSFVLINEYRARTAHGRFPIYHVDLYRIESDAELAGIGMDDALSGDGVCLIEWAERAANWLPAEHLAVFLRHLSETKRILRFVPYGSRATTLLEALKRVAFV